MAVITQLMYDEDYQAVSVGSRGSSGSGASVSLRQGAVCVIGPRLNPNYGRVYYRNSYEGSQPFLSGNFYNGNDGDVISIRNVGYLPFQTILQIYTGEEF